jgi:neutral amino acid transport system permease protein
MTGADARFLLLSAQLLEVTTRLRRRSLGRIHPAVALFGVLGVVVVALLATNGARALGQTTINGLVSGSYIALGAIGLTLVFGTLRLVNFAHGDYLTFGAYIALYLSRELSISLYVALIGAVIATAIFSVLLELSLWRPLRKRGVRTFQLMLVGLGLAYIIRNAIQLIAGANQRTLDVNLIDSYRFIGLRIGRTELIVAVVGFAVIVATALMLKFTYLGKQMRALADSITLAETTGIDTQKTVIVTWALSGVLAGLSGVLYAAPIGYITPNLGFSIVLSIFAAAVVGGIGKPYSALAGGILIGLAQEWSTLVIAPQMKNAVGFVIMIVVLIIRPRGLLGRTISVDRS